MLSTISTGRAATEPLDGQISVDPPGSSTRIRRRTAGRRRILLDERPGVPVARDGDPGPDHLGGPGRVRGPHGEAITDGQDRDVRLVDLADQLHVAEEPGVAGVVDRLPAHADHEAGGLARVAPLEARGVVGEGEVDATERHRHAATMASRPIRPLRLRRLPSSNPATTVAPVPWRARPCHRRGPRGRGSGDVGRLRSSAAMPAASDGVAHERIDQSVWVASEIEKAA